MPQGGTTELACCACQDKQELAFQLGNVGAAYPGIGGFAVVGCSRHHRAVAKQELSWQGLLVDGYVPLKKTQRVFRRLPRDPRCKLCRSPFGGLGGKLFRTVGRKPSPKNPNICHACFENLPTGGIEIDVGVVFADVRGSTRLGEQATPTEFAEKLNRFYATATKVVIHHDGVVDKLIGDEVMALFFPGFAGPDYRRKAALAALELSKVVDFLPVGVAANAGVAFVGNVGSGAVKDFTALGDAINTGARLQSHASPGEVVLASDLNALVAADYPAARSERIEVPGRRAGACRSAKCGIARSLGGVGESAQPLRSCCSGVGLQSGCSPTGSNR